MSPQAFLHREYRVETYWWEPVELVRKAVLTGVVNLIPEERAYERLVAALLLSVDASASSKEFATTLATMQQLVALVNPPNQATGGGHGQLPVAGSRKHQRSNSSGGITDAGQAAEAIAIGSLMTQLFESSRVLSELAQRLFPNGCSTFDVWDEWQGEQARVDNYCVGFIKDYEAELDVMGLKHGKWLCWMCNTPHAGMRQGHPLQNGGAVCKCADLDASPNCTPAAGALPFRDVLTALPTGAPTPDSVGLRTFVLFDSMHCMFSDGLLDKIVLLTLHHTDLRKADLKRHWLRPWQATAGRGGDGEGRPQPGRIPLCKQGLRGRMRRRSGRGVRGLPCLGPAYLRRGGGGGACAREVFVSFPRTLR